MLTVLGPCDAKSKLLPIYHIGLNFISLYTHVQNDNVINTNEQVNDIQNGIQKEVLGLMLTVSHCYS